MSEKTEQPTQKKLEEARKKGNVAQSRDASGVGAYVAGVALLGATAAAVSAVFESLYRDSMTLVRAGRLDPHALGGAIGATQTGILRASLPLLGAVALAGTALALAQTGIRFSAESLKPDLKKLNPLTKLKSWFEPKGLFELAKTFLKLGFVLGLGYLAAKGALPLLLRLSYAGPHEILSLTASTARHFLLTIAIVFAALGGADYGFQFRMWKKKLMMSVDEVKREYKESEGDPHVKGHRRQLAQEIAMGDVQHAVSHADAVTVNPTHLAVAIRYDRGTMRAPKVVAKGRETLAKKIVEIAKKNDVPIVRDITLTRALFELEVDANVPKELFEAVAEVLLFAWKVRAEENPDAARPQEPEG